MLELVFHALVLPVTIGSLWNLSRRRSLRTLLLGIAVVAGTGIALAVGVMLWMGGSRMFGARFAMIGLIAQGIFVHGPLYMLGAGVLLRREARGWSRACFALLAALLLVGFDAWFIEPTWLEVRHHRVESAKLTRPLRIVVLADIQTDAVGEYERRVIRTAVEQEPDLIVLPGDYVHVRSREDYEAELAALNELFREEGLTAPLGMVAVEGNCERPIWPRVFEGHDALTFVETTTAEREGIWLSGLSFGDSFDPAFELEGRAGFHIAVGHAPNFALGDVDADLLIAGHTHGGQIRLPFFGPPMTLSKVPRDWASGLTELDGGRTLVVSRGIGMEGGHAPRVRFLCRPELTVIDLVPVARARPSSPATSSNR